MRCFARSLSDPGRHESLYRDCAHRFATVLRWVGGYGDVRTQKRTRAQVACLYSRINVSIKYAYSSGTLKDGVCCRSDPGRFERPIIDNELPDSEVDMKSLMSFLEDTDLSRSTRQKPKVPGGTLHILEQSLHYLVQSTLPRVVWQAVLTTAQRSWG